MMTNRDAGLTDVQSWDEFGFRVNNIYMRGSVVCLPKFTLLWDVQHVSDISPESLSPVLMLKEPRIRILLIGTGKKMRNVNPALFGWFSRRGIAVEHMSTVSTLSASLRAPAPGARQVGPAPDLDGIMLLCGLIWRLAVRQALGANTRVSLRCCCSRQQHPDTPLLSL